MPCTVLTHRGGMANMRLLQILCACMLTFLASCSDLTGPDLTEEQNNDVTITQGIWGRVRFWEGDFMPSIGGRSSGTITPIEREVWIFQATRFDSVVGAGDGRFFKQILTEFVARVRSNTSGFYQVSLPPGKYSVFVVEGSLYYANGTDSAGHLVPGVVMAGAVTEVPVEITYKAAY